MAIPTSLPAWRPRSRTPQPPTTTGKWNAVGSPSPPGHSGRPPARTLGPGGRSGLSLVARPGVERAARDFRHPAHDWGPLGVDALAMAERLSAIDGSFLRVESPDAHMHVAWAATFRVPSGSPPAALPRLRRHISGRLSRVPPFRRRLAYPPPGMGEPFWVDDPDFDVARHVVALGTPGHELDDRRFALLCDSALSTQLDRSRPLWEIRLAPRLSGGRCAVVAKIHHALVDGRPPVEGAQLLLDIDPSGVAELPAPWKPAPAPGQARLAAAAVARGAGESLP